MLVMFKIPKKERLRTFFLWKHHHFPKDYHHVLYSMVTCDYPLFEDTPKSTFFQKPVVDVFRKPLRNPTKYTLNPPKTLWLWLTVCHGSHGPNRNRWCLPFLKNGWIFPVRWPCSSDSQMIEPPIFEKNQNHRIPFFKSLPGNIYHHGIKILITNHNKIQIHLNWFKSPDYIY